PVALDAARNCRACRFNCGVPTRPNPSCAGSPGGVATVKRRYGREPGRLRVEYTSVPSCSRSYRVPLNTPKLPHRLGVCTALSSTVIALQVEPGSGAVAMLTVPFCTQR